MLQLPKVWKFGGGKGVCPTSDGNSKTNTLFPLQISKLLAAVTLPRLALRIQGDIWIKAITFAINFGHITKDDISYRSATVSFNSPDQS